jgi:pectate lyase
MVGRSTSLRSFVVRWLIAQLALVAIFVVTTRAAEEPASSPTTTPAFPGAEGFGASTPGGRGGEVYEVTNLNDSGPGSLRDAISKDHRTIVFRVSGTIDLESPIVMKQPFITIAGQTAPGDGICVRYYNFGIQSHDIVIRYIRSRLGDQKNQESDSISILNGCRDVILDHCSTTWSVDEDLSTSGIDSNITVQWCLIGEPLNKSIHKKGAHGYGSLARANGPVSWYHNLWAHCDSRSPRLGDFYNRPGSPTFDVRNNVIYDYGGTCSGLTQGVFKANYVGNYIRPGPSSKARAPITLGTPSDLTYFIRDNIWEGHDDLTADNSQFFTVTGKDVKELVHTVNEPVTAPPFKAVSAREALEMVLVDVGATKPKRDSVDARIIETVRNHTGQIIDSQQEVGGWPELKSTMAPTDSDHDGIPDEWETQHGLNPHDPTDGAKVAGKDGYTNLEVYLNELAAKK